MTDVWLSNAPWQAVRERLEKTRPDWRVVSGPPKATAWHSAEKLSDMGYVGIYRVVPDAHAEG